jgi:hypothetical protein
MKPLLKFLGRAASVLVALVVLFEEWGWESLHWLMAQLGKLPLLRQLEVLVTRLPPTAALVVLGLPALLLVPVKLVALWLIGSGQPGFGLAVIVAAKVLGTAIVARLFALTRPALMRIGWFAAFYPRWMAWKTSMLAIVRASWAWRMARVIKRRALRRWARWRATRWS